MTLIEIVTDIKTSTEESNFISSLDYLDEKTIMTTEAKVPVMEKLVQTTKKKYSFLDLITGKVSNNKLKFLLKMVFSAQTMNFYSRAG